MGLPVVSLITGAFKIVGGAISSWQERKQLEQKTRLEIEKAKSNAIIEQAKRGQVHEFKWDEIMAQGSMDSWKDEWFVILLSIPAVLCFIPGLDVYVTRGFVALAATPDWYKAAFGIAVAASFGFRKFGNYMMDRKEPAPTVTSEDGKIPHPDLEEEEEKDDGWHRPG